MAQISVLQGRAAASAYIDPTFALAPGVADATSHRIVFSAGIGNKASLVPEPSSWLLTLVGLGCLTRVRRASI